MQSSGDRFISRSSSQIQYQHVHSQAQLDHEDLESTSDVATSLGADGSRPISASRAGPVASAFSCSGRWSDSDLRAWVGFWRETRGVDVANSCGMSVDARILDMAGVN